jgi:hypothetical protein
MAKKKSKPWRLFSRPVTMPESFGVGGLAVWVDKDILGPEFSGNDCPEVEQYAEDWSVKDRLRRRSSK